MAICESCVHNKVCKYGENRSNGMYCTGEKCKQYLSTADVVEVKHGCWKDRYGNKYDNHLYECSVCGKEALYEFYSNELGQEESRQALTPTCPHCGAKMDGERRRCSNDNNTI